ncbi:MAG: ferredoxin [Candidatus Aenigmarchaeota archaeon]|nr:ferredoxin [Candidatus Aenigmarchaeota archaeon]
MGVDESKCIGCGVRESVCPEAFEMKDGKSHVKNPDAECTKKAILSCPVGAITE